MKQQQNGLGQREARCLRDVRMLPRLSLCVYGYGEWCGCEEWGARGGGWGGGGGWWVVWLECLDDPCLLVLFASNGQHGGSSSKSNALEHRHAGHHHALGEGTGSAWEEEWHTPRKRKPSDTFHEEEEGGQPGPASCPPPPNHPNTTHLFSMHQFLLVLFGCFVSLFLSTRAYITKFCLPPPSTPCPRRVLTK